MAIPRILVGEFKMRVPGGEVYRQGPTALLYPSGGETFGVRCTKHPHWYHTFKANIWAAADPEGTIATAAEAALKMCPECADLRIYKSTRFPEGAEL